MKNMLNILLLVVFLIILLIGGRDTKTLDNFDPLTKIQDGPRKIQDDKLYSDVIVYDNDNQEGYGRSGLDKCLEYCKGTCLEYGVTGIAHCFPRDNSIKRNYYTTLRDKEYETEEIDRAGTKISYPNLR
jgi:uncharacterized protein YxeA